MTKPAKTHDRICDVCGANAGVSGPLASSWDGTLVDGALLLSCSPQCRAERGWVERRVRTKGAA